MSDSSSPNETSGPLRGLLVEAASLFPAGGRTSALLALALLLQIAYWYLGSPGPGAPRDPATALRTVLWATLLLGLLPLALLRPLKLRPADLGLAAGDRRTGLRLLAVGVPVAIAVGYLASGDAAVRSSYPWPGGWAGETPTNFLTWSLVYLLYYLSYEFFYRGFLLRGLEGPLGRHGALWLQTTASTLLHLGKPLGETIAALPGGILFGLVALRTRSLLYVVIIHYVLGVSTDLFSLLAGSGG